MIEIPVTQDDIDAGVPDYMEPDRCVVALALKRHFGEDIYLGVGSRDMWIGEKRAVYVFDESLLKFGAIICDAFHKIEHVPVLPGVIRLDKQTMTASYEEKLG